MKRYQLRYPKERSVEDLVDELSWTLWEKFSQRSELEGRGSNLPIYTGMHNTLREILQRHVTQYDMCGLSRQCEEGASPGAWAATAASAPREEETTWYVLEMEGELGQLVREVADGLIQILLELGAGTALGSPEELRLLAEEGLKQTLGPYLFENVSCGETLLCRDATKLNPWVSP